MGAEIELSEDEAGTGVSARPVRARLRAGGEAVPAFRATLDWGRERLSSLFHEGAASQSLVHARAHLVDEVLHQRLADVPARGAGRPVPGGGGRLRPQRAAAALGHRPAGAARGADAGSAQGRPGALLRLPVGHRPGGGQQRAHGGRLRRAGGTGRDRGHQPDRVAPAVRRPHAVRAAAGGDDAGQDVAGGRLLPRQAGRAAGALRQVRRYRLQAGAQRQGKPRRPARHPHRGLGGQAPLQRPDPGRAARPRLPHQAGVRRAVRRPGLPVAGALRPAHDHRPPRGPAAVRPPDQAGRAVRLRGLRPQQGGRAVHAALLPHDQVEAVPASTTCSPGSCSRRRSWARGARPRSSRSTRASSCAATASRRAPTTCSKSSRRR